MLIGHSCIPLYGSRGAASVKGRVADSKTLNLSSFSSPGWQVSEACVQQESSSELFSSNLPAVCMIEIWLWSMLLDEPLRGFCVRLGLELLSIEDDVVLE